MKERQLIDAIVRAVDNALAYQAMDVSADIVYKAVLFELVVIGEAANKISDGMKRMHTHVPWHRMIAVRNRLAHDPDSVDACVIGEIVTQHLPVLRQCLMDIRKELQGE